MTVLEMTEIAGAPIEGVVGLLELVGDGDLAALLRVIKGRLGRAIDVAYAASQGDGGAVVAFRD